MLYVLEEQEESSYLYHDLNVYLRVLTAQEIFPLLFL